MESKATLLQTGAERQHQLVGPQPRGRGTYVQQACTACRTKKVRCDGQRPVCGTCENSSRPSECSWSKDGTPLRKRTNEAFVESLKKRNDALRDYTAFLESELERCRREHGGNADSAYLHRRPEDIEIPLDDFDPTDYGGQDDEPMDLETYSIRGLIAPIQRLTLLEGGGLITYGSTSVFRFRPINIQNAPSRFPAITENPDDTYVLLLEGVDESHYNPDLDWARYLPKAVPLDRRGHDKALDLLFKFLTAWCLRVVPPLFLRDMYRALSVPRGQTPPQTTHYSPMLHNALLALGLAFLDDPAVRDYKARQYFAEEAKKHIETECSKPNLCSVNALSIIATFHSSQGDQTLGFMYFGMSARMSQALGLDVDCSEWVKLGLIEETDVLDRYWTYWTTFAQDVNWSLYVGRDFCVRAPSESEFRDMPVPFVDSELDKLPFTHPDVPTQSNFLSKTFAATCELLVIARRIMNVVNGINKTRVRQSVIDDAITDIDLQLNTWKSSLHPDVDLTPKNKLSATPHKLMLHMAYWWQFILLHRPYFHRCPKLCRRAAQHIMDLLAVWRQLYTLRYVPITIVQPLFAAGTIFLLSGVQATSGIRVAQKELTHCVDSIKRLLQYLREIGKSWQCALNIESILRALVEEQLKPAIDKRQTGVPKDKPTGPETEREKYKTIPPIRRPSATRRVERHRQASIPAPSPRSRSTASSEQRTPIKLGSPTIAVHPVPASSAGMEGSFGQPPLESPELLSPWNASPARSSPIQVSRPRSRSTGSQQLSVPTDSPPISLRMPPSPSLSNGPHRSMSLSHSNSPMSFYDSNSMGFVPQSPVQSMHNGVLDKEALFSDMGALGAGEGVTNFDYNNFEMARFLAMPSGNNLSGVPFVGPLTIEEYIGSLQDTPGDTSPDGIFDFSSILSGADFNAEASGSAWNGSQYLSGGSPIGFHSTINHHRRAVSEDSRPMRMGGGFNGNGFPDFQNPFP